MLLLISVIILFRKLLELRLQYHSITLKNLDTHLSSMFGGGRNWPYFGIVVLVGVPYFFFSTNSLDPRCIFVRVVWIANYGQSNCMHVSQCWYTINLSYYFERWFGWSPSTQPTPHSMCSWCWLVWLEYYNSAIWVDYLHRVCILVFILHLPWGRF